MSRVPRLEDNAKCKCGLPATRLWAWGSVSIPYCPDHSPPPGSIMVLYGSGPWTQDDLDVLTVLTS